MKCGKCGTEMKDGYINTQISENNGKEIIDLTIDCPNCETQYFTFIKTEDLIEVP